MDYLVEPNHENQYLSNADFGTATGYFECRILVDLCS